MKLDGSPCSLSAVGSLALKKDDYTDTNHFEYPELFSRGLRLTNYSEVLFLTGYSATAAMRPLEFKGIENLVLDAEGQMQWIVDHLDKFFETIPYADGSGVYSKHDIVYFDLVIDKTVGAEAQTAVLKVLEKWFADVKPKPSTGILKKIEALAFPSTKVEIEFILAH
jgi:enamine deaminase RidA (YjgF/YER057c/UK114 family)